MFEGLMNVASGGLVGLVGVGLQVVFKTVSDWINFKHKIELKKLDLELAAHEHKFQLDKAALEIERATQESADRALQSSYSHDRSTYLQPFAGVIEGRAWLAIPLALLFALVDFLRGIIRPGMTIGLLILTAVMYLEAMEILNRAGLVPGEHAISLVTKVMDMILFLTATAGTWWFGARFVDKRK